MTSSYNKNLETRFNKVYNDIIIHTAVEMYVTVLYITSKLRIKKGDIHVQ